ncbi:hypothetical protein X766_15600 [Mesorhizobium sp. LSJC255A00]|nr:hypothetical protein X766_15600 [Mesorhizobium sp. LSJC255A00]ESX38307.1 hypothetical protein X764_21980 [Mesorhizobium sp. LSHC440A00]
MADQSAHPRGHTEIETRRSFAGHQAVFEAIERHEPEQPARRCAPAGCLQSYSAIRSSVTRTTEFRPSAAGCAQGAGFDGFEATSDPSLPALARLGFS